jgi:hypothetical protein
MWCAVIGDQQLGLCIILLCVNGDIYAGFLQNELPVFFRERYFRCRTVMTEHPLILVGTSQGM